jgi:hypothetical protein
MRLSMACRRGRRRRGQRAGETAGSMRLSMADRRASTAVDAGAKTSRPAREHVAANARDGRSDARETAGPTRARRQDRRARVWRVDAREHCARDTRPQPVHARNGRDRCARAQRSRRRGGLRLDQPKARWTSPGSAEGAVDASAIVGAMDFVRSCRLRQRCLPTRLTSSADRKNIGETSLSYASAVTTNLR